MTIWYSIFKAVLFKPVTTVWFRVKVEGLENIPEDGCILAANHLDAGDVVALPSVVKPQLTFPAKRELFMGKGVGGKIVSWFLKATGQTSIDRSGGRASASALDGIQKILAEGGVVAIFPEGTRSPDGNLYKGHTGVARLALDQDKPVVPVGLVNTRFVRSRIGIPTMRGAKVIFGKPLDFSKYRGQNNNHSVLRWVTNEVMGAIQTLTGQDYFDVYASRVKRGTLSADKRAAFAKSSPNADITAPQTSSAVEPPQAQGSADCATTDPQREPKGTQ